ncbi:MAG TPA: hypothetical protein VJS66_04805 [Burkholderiales bacterium]|nr:hypothetical protein [Burkholderiales bacterium]
MTEPKQYLRMSFGTGTYLLPSTSGYTIEQRENLVASNAANSNVCAWRSVRGSRWPAFALDDQLQPVRRDDWQRAVFIEALPHAFGMIVDDVHMLPRAQMQVSPFTPLGPAPTRVGHLFSGAWVTEDSVMLVFEPKTLIAYLQSLEE